MMDRGLFSDDSGNVSRSVKNKLLDLLGYKGMGFGRDLRELQVARCGEENLILKDGQAEVKSYDDHAVHITEHTAFLLSEKLTCEQEKRIVNHIEQHKIKLSEVQNG
jgi:hypothetical protein